MAAMNIEETLSALTLNQDKLLKAQEKMQKALNKLIKKLNGDGKSDNGNPPAKKEPSGFAKPCLLSSVLYEFLGIPEGTKIARTEVTKSITKYIKDHNLQDTENKRVINLDDKMKKLLNPPADTIVNFFSLQKLMKPHYIHESKSSSATVASEPVATGKTSTKTVKAA